METYADGFMKTFSEEEEYRNFLLNRQANAKWEDFKVKEMLLLALTNDESTDWVRLSLEEKHGKEVIADTLSGTGMAAIIGEEIYPIRSTAMKTLQERARISGHSLRELPRTLFAEILNYCVRTARGKGLLYFVDGKISAVHAGNKGNYCVLPMYELYDCAKEYLENKFHSIQFTEGYYDHSITSVRWNIEDSGLLKNYTSALDKHGIAYEKVMPSIRMSTSNVGVSGANLQGYLDVGMGRTIVIGDSIKLEHKHGANLDKFRKNLDYLFTMYTQELETLLEGLSTMVGNPADTMLRVMKKIGIPKGIAMQAKNHFVDTVFKDEVTAFDLYFGVCECVFIAQCQGYSGARLIELEENVSKALYINWTDFEDPGFIW